MIAEIISTSSNQRMLCALYHERDRGNRHFVFENT